MKNNRISSLHFSELKTKERGQNSPLQEFRVLHVVGAFLKGGTESFILNYFEALRKDNVTFDVYCFNVVDEEQKKRLIALGGNLYQGLAPSKKGLFEAARHFKKFLKEHEYYHVVHCNANFDSALYARIAKRKKIATIVCHAHDTLTGIRFNFAQKIVMSFKRATCCLNADKFLACSEEAGEDIFGTRFFKKNGVVIKNAINPKLFQSIKEENLDQLYADYHIPRDKIILGNISRFEDKKNQQFLIHLFDLLSQGSDKYYLVLGGVDGGTLSSIKQLAEHQDRILFIGPRNDVANWLHLFDYFLMPSLFEGFGIAALESQLAGCPTIVSNNFPQTIDLEIGLVKYLPLDVHLWADGLSSFQKPNVNDEHIYKALLARGLEINSCAAELLNIYK
jgi:glycosyltransferase EpsF